MKQIKTIINRRDAMDIFDTEVNQALLEGWMLLHRYIDQGFCEEGSRFVFYPVLVAELEREI